MNNNNFRLTKTKQNCTNCIWFESFESIYEDPLEPWDFGWCRNNENESYLVVDLETICDYHKRV